MVQHVARLRASHAGSPSGWGSIVGAQRTCSTCPRGPRRGAAGRAALGAAVRVPGSAFLARGVFSCELLADPECRIELIRERGLAWDALYECRGPRVPGRRTRRTAEADPGGGVPGAVPHVAPTHTPAGPRRASARTNRKRVTAAPAARTATGCGRRPARSVYTKDRTLRPRTQVHHESLLHSRGLD